MPLRKLHVDARTSHELDQSLLINVRRLEGALADTVPQHRDAMRDPEHLRQPMRYEQNRRTTISGIPHEPESMIDAVCVEG